MSVKLATGSIRVKTIELKMSLGGSTYLFGLQPHEQPPLLFLQFRVCIIGTLVAHTILLSLDPSQLCLRLLLQGPFSQLQQRRLQGDLNTSNDVAYYRFYHLNFNIIVIIIFIIFTIIIITIITTNIIIIIIIIVLLS